MTPADGIRKLGFRRWYERQLIESHAYLVTGFLCMVLVLGCLEEASPRAPGLKPLLMLALVVGAGLLCMFSLERYRRMLFRAEELAEQSTCRECGTYGILRITASKPVPAADTDGDAGQEPFSVQCRRCGHQWTMGPH